MSAARDGAHVAFPAYPMVNSTPLLASESMFGVGTAPPATPPPFQVRSFHPRSSTRMTTTLGGRSDAGRAGVMGPGSQLTSRVGPIGSRRRAMTPINSGWRMRIDGRLITRSAPTRAIPTRAPRIHFQVLMIDHPLEAPGEHSRRATGPFALFRAGKPRTPGTASGRVEHGCGSAPGVLPERPSAWFPAGACEFRRRAPSGP